MVSKQEILGQKIMKRIHIHNQDDGGIFTFTTGAMGSGKTSVLLSFIDYTLNHHGNEKIFISECYNTPIQSFKLHNKKRCFYFMDGIDFRLRDRNNGFKPFQGEHVEYFSGFQELYEMAKPGVANIVFFGNRLYWMDFIEYVNMFATDWNHFFLEEFSEICPAYQKGELGNHIADFADVLKDCRKNLINIHTNTQQASRIDYRPLLLIMVYIFLPGARERKHLRVAQRAIDNLKSDSNHGNQAYLEMSGEFGLTTFRDIYRPNPLYHVDCYCNNGERVPFIISSFHKSMNMEDKAPISVDFDLMKNG